MKALRTAVAAALAAGALIVLASPAAAVTERVSGAVANQANPDLQLPPPDPVTDGPAPSKPAPSNPAPSNPEPSNPSPSNPSPSEPQVEEPSGPTPEELQAQRDAAAAAAALAARIRKREALKRSAAVDRLADATGKRTTATATAVAEAVDEDASQATIDLSRLEKTREGGNLIDPRIVALGAAAVLLIGIGGVTSGRRRTGGGFSLPWRDMSLPSFGGGVRGGREGGRQSLPTAIERFVGDRLGEIVVAIAALAIIALALYLIANPGFLFS